MKKKRRLFAAIISAGMLFFSACGQNAARSNADGIALYEEEKYEKALIKFNQAITQDEENGMYYTNRGMTYLMMEQYTEALADFQKAIQTGGDTMESHRGLGILYMNTEDYESAVSEFDQAIALTGTTVDSLDYDILEHKVTAQVMMKDYNGAVETYTTLIQLGVNTSRNYLYRGILYLKGGETYLQYALEDFDEAVAAITDVKTDYYEIYLTAYETLESYGYTEEARTYVERAMALSPETPEEVFEQGRLYFSLQEYEAAKELFSQASAQGIVEAEYYIAKCAEKQGQYETAKEIYERLMQQEAFQTAESYNQLASCMVMLGNDTEAEILYQQALALDKDGTMEPYILWNQAVMYENQKEYEKAYQILLTYAKKFPMGDRESKKLAYLKNR